VRPFTLVRVAEEGGTAELAEFAQSYSSPAIAIVSLDETQEGDPVTREPCF